MIIPTNKYPNQYLTVILNKQKCQIAIKQKTTGVFVDIIVDDKVMVIGQIVLDRVPILFEDYRGFVGSIEFNDTQKQENPDFSGFNGRFLLIYNP